MRTFFFLPPLKKTTGGLAVLFDMAACLHQDGREVLLAPREGRGPAGSEDIGAPIVPWDELDIRPDDLWLAPEGWVNGLFPGLTANARCVIYCQNWAYLLSSLPEGVDLARLNVAFLGVSQPVSWYISQATGREAPILRPGIDTTFFTPPEAKPEAPVRIAYMPRKNKALAQRIREMIDARAGLRGQHDAIEWVEISGQDRHGVHERLRSAHIFLATGFPEGCPLPPLEAMACGCLCVGFSGFGGWDYMRQADWPGPGRFDPWWPMRPAQETPWSGNGLWVADADVPAAVAALEEGIRWWMQGDDRLAHTIQGAFDTAENYSLQHHRARVIQIWNDLEQGVLFP